MNQSSSITQSSKKLFIIAWVLGLVFYFIDYATRSAPSLMITDLAQNFNISKENLVSLIGTYYYTYSIFAVCRVFYTRNRMHFIYRFLPIRWNNRQIITRSGQRICFSWLCLFSNQRILFKIFSNSNRLLSMYRNAWWSGRSICGCAIIRKWFWI